MNIVAGTAAFLWMPENAERMASKSMSDEDAVDFGLESMRNFFFLLLARRAEQRSHPRELAHHFVFTFAAGAAVRAGQLRDEATLDFIAEPFSSDVVRPETPFLRQRIIRRRDAGLVLQTITDDFLL